MVKMKVDEGKCIGCGACAATCPDSFEMRDGHAAFKADSECASDAMVGCPVGAITEA